MKNILVSVIIPVYNVERYLAECLDSVTMQDYRDLEIIIVDDGSTDASPAICDGYAAHDGRIHVIHQQNMGAATARRVGISHATGKYTCFVDSDDKIRSNMVKEFVENIGDCDLITSGCCVHNLDGSSYERKDAFPEGVYQTDGQMGYIISNMITYERRFEDGFLPFLVTKMYRTDILKAVVGDVDLTITYAEDRDLLFRYVLKCRSVIVTHRIYYEYILREGSATQVKNSHFLEQLNKFYLSLEPVFRKHPLGKELVCQLQLFIVSRLNDAPNWMGFCPEAYRIRQRYIMTENVCGMRVVLYGAGRVGKDYYNQIMDNPHCKLVAWVDKNFGGCVEGDCLIEPPERLAQLEYDCIIIAIKKESVAMEVRQELGMMGIPQGKIVWKYPVMVTF
jgi:glycosyltransferase involved in cell wall biosynthesis